ncbi:MAG: hypothetical protein CME88_16940 [Hirschia sp.]|nr:hypothetical protein [Hirschia sp.]MBF20063.1 hypothetical protein [Hirschia sp.]
MNATAYLRVYTEKPRNSDNAETSNGGNRMDSPSDWTLVFDCETTVDAAQTLRVGFFQARKGSELVREGIFYEPATLTASEIEAVRAYAGRNELDCITLHEFQLRVFMRLAYEARATVVGFNLPFDLSRVALSAGEARGGMRGGFSFNLMHSKRFAPVRVKHLSSTASLIDFATPAEQITPRGMRKRNLKVAPHRGYFIDLRTIASALLSRKHSLKSLAEFLEVSTQKLETDEHGGPITPDYLDYARADVQASWECFCMLKDQYAQHGLSKPLHRILSEASIGKAYLEEMGITPLLTCQPDLPRGAFGPLMSAYFGGRAEAHDRRRKVEVLYTDFKSMYPTVNALMDLMRFLRADSYSQRDATEEIKAFLDKVTLADLQNKTTWPNLVCLVWLRPDEDVLPLRTTYSDNPTKTIGLNTVSSDQLLCYSLADVVASKLLTGKTPRIERAVCFEPGPLQTGLNPIKLFGQEDYSVDPRTDDIFVRLVDLRDEAKRKGDPRQQAIKIIANATCYGIYVEVQRDDAPKPEKLSLYGPDGVEHQIQHKALEQPGKFFHPLLAVMITGAARLMLALAERLTLDQGLNYAFCDTDSIAMSRPNGMAREDFHARTQTVIDWFEPLNPYKAPGSILKREDANDHWKKGEPAEPLYCVAISAKRYALFNIGENGRPIIRKASAHGLGHLMEPYGKDDPAPNVPPPVFPLNKIGVSRWQYDLWFYIITAVLNGTPNQVPRDYHPALAKPALSRYGATSPALLKWMDMFNEGKAWRDQVKPFNFMTTFFARTGVFAPFAETLVDDPSRRGRPKKTPDLKPVAPFERNPGIAVSKAFDRDTDEPISRDQLKTYAQVLTFYHLSPEDKFENGGPVDIGLTRRRHVRVTAIKLIGKEANKVGDFGEEDPASAAMVEFEVREKETI